MVTLLEPLKQQLEVLELDFRGYPESETILCAFRPISSLAAFTALKKLSLGRLSIMPPESYSRDADHMMQRQIRQLRDISGVTKDFLVKLLPCRSLESLELDDNDDVWDHHIVELARRTNLGEFPNLRHVRLRPDIVNYNRVRHMRRRYVEQDHALHRLVPERYWKKSYSESSGGLIMESEVRPLFRKAGVLFERTVVRWYARAKEDSEPVDGLVEVYPQDFSEREYILTFSITARNEDVESFLTPST